jgi:outer membrane immunogenic protein
MCRSITKLLMAAAVASISFVGVASAADMPVKALPPILPPCDWCGFYIGANAGGIVSDGTAFFGGDPSTTAAIARGQLPVSIAPHGAGFIGGGQIGYNKQVNRFVWGIEADWQGTTLDRTVSFSSNLAPAFFPATTTVGERVDFIGTVRGRVGFTATPALLLYATGGLAYADTRLTSSVTTSPVPPAVGGCAAAGICGSASNSEWRAGWTAGAGAEWKFRGPWSAKVEYLYYDVGRANLQYSDSLGRFPGTFVTTSERFTGNIVRVGINYAFSSGPVVAKY